MNKVIRIVMMGEAEQEYKRLNEIVGQQMQQGKENTQEM